VEQQTYRSCIGLLKLADKYSEQQLEAACEKALGFTASPSYKSVKNILETGVKAKSEPPKQETTPNKYGITRGSKYYGGKNDD
jgi:hypothetical protein